MLCSISNIFFSCSSTLLMPHTRTTENVSLMRIIGILNYQQLQMKWWCCEWVENDFDNFSSINPRTFLCILNGSTEYLFVFWFSLHSPSIYSQSKCIHHSTSLFHNKITSKCSLERRLCGRKTSLLFFEMALFSISEFLLAWILST